jgi:aminoglycoside 3-N-acetyltransferase
MKPEVHETEIEEGLRALGVGPGATVLVHSSLSSFGHVAGGAEAVIRALVSVVGREGNIVMPTLSFGSVNEEDPAYSVTDTPSDTGRITEVFRRLPGVRRSRHPLSSAAVMGPDAAEFTSGPHTTPCGPDSPYFRVYANGGTVLFLGAGFRSNTMFHVAEELAAPAYMRYKRLDGVRVTLSDGRTETGTFYRYDCYQTGIVRRLERLEALYREAGMIRETSVGSCAMMAISAKDNVDLACKVLKERPEYILE